MLLFSLHLLLKYSKKKKKKVKFFVIASFFLPLPEVFFCIYWIVSLGFLVVSLRTASFLCSGTDIQPLTLMGIIPLVALKTKLNL